MRDNTHTTDSRTQDPGTHDRRTHDGRIQDILVPVDFSPTAEAALRYALHLAETYGARLHVLHVAATHEVSAAELEMRLEQLFVHAAGQEAARPSFSVRFGDAVRQILRAATDADLVVMGQDGGHSRVLRHTSRVTTAVARQAPCGVVPVGEPQEGAALGFAFHWPQLPEAPR